MFSCYEIFLKWNPTLEIFIFQELNFLVGECNSNSTAANADVGWGENPKNILIKTVAFQNMCCGKGARPLPVTVRSSGPDHLKVYPCCIIFFFSNERCRKLESLSQF